MQRPGRDLAVEKRANEDGNESDGEQEFSGGNAHFDLR
jgi:hypothetical protein